MKRFALVLLILTGLPGGTLRAAERGQLEKKDYMIPMRDGVRLHTEVWTEVYAAATGMTIASEEELSE